ncbi:MAG: terpene cyclase/mutase family protein [Planctomycetales bacterium]|nr:terpene cyclase/mutase family protein [Planctomycetales bacterium]
MNPSPAPNPSHAASDFVDSPSPQSERPLSSAASRGADGGTGPSTSWFDRLSDWLAGGDHSAWLASAAVHLLLLILLSLLLYAHPPRGVALWLEGDALGPTDEAASVDFTLSEGSDASDAAPGAIAATPGGDDAVLSTSAPAAPPALSVDLAASSPRPSLGGFHQLANPLALRGGGMGGRQGEQRRRLALGGGGSEASESAVERGLAWLAAHQLENGGWVFDLENRCPQCRGYCRNSGMYDSTTAATGLALLSFLGAGYTHEEGKYRETVAKGLYYLQEQMAVTSRGGDLRDQRAHNDDSLPPGVLRIINAAGASRFDTMYSHGIATLALTEAYAMSRDASLREPAQLAINFIVNAQYNDGGWRYVPAPESPGPGDMTVSGWQITALKSGLIAGLDIPYDIWERIEAFIDGLQGDSPSSYLYLRGERGTNATTAIGLLVRMIGGWPRDSRPLNVGLAKLGTERPSANNIYFIFYASQVLHHAGGAQWKKWNPQMRDYLVDSQATEGHEDGSWYFAEAHSQQGGRLYTTAMAIMTLEVYYRYMPLYQEAFVDTAP